jgi:hypothetical protein
MEGDPIEFKCLERGLSEIDLEKFKDKNIIEIIQNDVSVVFKFDDESTMTLKSSKISSRRSGILINEFNGNTFGKAEISGIFLRSGVFLKRYNVIHIMVGSQFGDDIVVDVDIESFTISYLDVELKMTELEGRYIATFTKCVKFENKCIYLDDGTSININADVFLTGDCDMLGKNIAIIANNEKSVILGDDTKMLTYYGKRTDLTHRKGG